MIRFSTKANPERMQKQGDKFQNNKELELRRLHCLLDIGKKQRKEIEHGAQISDLGTEMSLTSVGKET